MHALLSVVVAVVPGVAKVAGVAGIPRVLRTWQARVVWPRKARVVLGSFGPRKFVLRSLGSLKK